MEIGTKVRVKSGDEGVIVADPGTFDPHFSLGPEEVFALLKTGIYAWKILRFLPEHLEVIDAAPGG